MGSDPDKRPGPVEDDEIGFEERMAAVPAAADEVGAAVWMRYVSYVCSFPIRKGGVGGWMAGRRGEDTYYRRNPQDRP